MKELERPNSSAGDENAPISIPPALVPVLALLRQHIRELTRENSALRYTFLGSHTPARQEVISLSVGATPPTTGDVSPATPLEPMSAGRTPLMDHKAVSTAPDVDLEAVLTRVKTLMLENEELGDLVAETGQASSDEWLKALEDSRAVIASLEYVKLRRHGLVKLTSQFRSEREPHCCREAPRRAGRLQGAVRVSGRSWSSPRTRTIPISRTITP